MPLTHALVRAFPLAVLLVALTPTALAGGHEVDPDATPPWADGRSRGEDLRIYLATIGPGRESEFARFGHTGIIIADATHDVSLFYNYGTYTFQERNAYAKAATGTALYWVSASDTLQFMREYRALDRDVRVMLLDLPPESRVELAAAVARNAEPENRYYRYHPFEDNCSTRVRDLLDRALGGRLRESVDGPANATLRVAVAPYYSTTLVSGYVSSFFANARLDEPLTRWDTLFLPLELEAAVANLTVPDGEGGERPLVSESWSWHTSSAGPMTGPIPLVWPLILAGGVLIGAIAVKLGTRSRRSGAAGRALGAITFLVGVVFGVPGFLLSMAWAFDGYNMQWPNINLLLANALTLALVPAGIAAARGQSAARWRVRETTLVLAGLAAIALAVRAVGLTRQDTWLHLALVLPILVGLTVAWRAAPPMGPPSDPHSPPETI